jgi:hypothetical protein
VVRAQINGLDKHISQAHHVNADSSLKRTDLARRPDPLRKFHGKVQSVKALSRTELEPVEIKNPQSNNVIFTILPLPLLSQGELT